jgi:uncharacterized protein YceK
MNSPGRESSRLANANVSDDGGGDVIRFAIATVSGCESVREHDDNDGDPEETSTTLKASESSHPRSGTLMIAAAADEPDTAALED